MKKNGDEFVEAQPHAPLSTGEVIRMLRELKGWTQAETRLPLRQQELS